MHVFSAEGAGLPTTLQLYYPEQACPTSSYLVLHFKIHGGITEEILPLFLAFFIKNCLTGDN